MPHVAADTSAKALAPSACKLRNASGGGGGDLTEPSTSAVTLLDPASGALFKVPCEHRYALDYMYSLRRSPHSLAPLPTHLSQLINSGPNSRWTVRRPNNGPPEPFMGCKSAGNAGPNGGRGVGGGHRFASEEFQTPMVDVLHQQSSLLGVPSHLRPTGKSEESLLAAEQAAETLKDMPPPPPPQASNSPETKIDAPSPNLIDGPPPGTGWSSDTSPATGFGGPAGGGRSWGMHEGTIYSEQMPSPAHGKIVDMENPAAVYGGDYGREQQSWDDLWDSPVEGADCGNIFTLGDIRQAEHAIEVQGIPAEAYVNHETRKILKAQSHQRPAVHGTMIRSAQDDVKEAQGISQDIFFGEVRANALEGRSGADAGESRFISMFGPQGGGGGGPPPMAHPPPQQTPPYQRRDYVGQQQAAAAAVLHSLPYAQQQQIAATWLAARQNPEDKPVADKQAVRDHLLKLLGLNRSEPVSEPARPPGLSRPMNPAAPNFAPSGLFNPALAAQLPTSDLQAKRVSGSIPPPPPPTDYRRPINNSPAEQPHWIRRDMAHQPNDGMPAQPGPMPQHPSGSAELSELLQRLVTKHQIAQQMTQQSPGMPEQNLSAQQLLQRQLLAHGNLMPEQVSQVMQHINRNKGAAASQLLMGARQKEAQMNNGHAHMARPKSMKGNDGSSPAVPQMGSPGGGGISPANQALLQHAAASLRQQAAAYGTGSPNASAAALAQHLATMQNALQQQQQGGADAVRQQATQKQLAIFVQHLQRLRAQQKQQKPPANSPPLPQHHQSKQQQQVYLTNALEQITQNVQRIKAANANQQQRPLPMQQPLPLNRAVSPVASQPAWNMPSTQQVTPPHLGGVNIPQPAPQSHQPPTMQQQQQNLEARAQLSALLRELVSQGGGANAAATTLSLLLQKTPPNHTIHLQIQQLLQQRAEQGRTAPADPGLRPSSVAAETTDKENGRPFVPSEPTPVIGEFDAPTPKDPKEEVERNGLAALNDGLTNRVSSEDL